MSKTSDAKNAIEASLSYKDILAVLGEERFLAMRQDIIETVKASTEYSLKNWAERMLAFADYKAYREVASNPWNRKAISQPARHLIDLINQPKVEGYAYVDSRPEAIYNREVANLKAGNYKVNDEKCIALGTEMFEGSKLFFAFRVAKKIAELLPATTHVKVDLQLDRGVLVGFITCYQTATDSVGQRLKVNLKTNYRYGENSANGDITIYHQVPCTLVKG